MPDKKPQLEFELGFESEAGSASPPPKVKVMKKDSVRGRKREEAEPVVRNAPLTLDELVKELTEFSEFGKSTIVEKFPEEGVDLPVFVNEFWTAKQRAASTLHEISYRACFKPQLPRFFIERLTMPGDIVYDPFMGRGTTLLESALMGRTPCGCDVNPISRILIESRLDPPQQKEVEERVHSLDLDGAGVVTPDELLVFYHPKTLRAIGSLRQYFIEKQSAGTLDAIDRWIRTVCTNRLTGHSPGFFSVYTMPPNQAVSVVSQIKINERRNQTPPERPVAQIIIKKSRQLLKEVTISDRETIQKSALKSQLLSGLCDSTPEIEDDSVSLVVTSPPFLNVVDYQTDNWLRCWFNGVDAKSVPVWQLRNAEKWTAAMTGVFRELRRILKPGGFVAFEVGEVRKGKLLMETLVVPAAEAAGLVPRLVLVNDQVFTKTANCWGVDNLRKGTNTNRIILLQKS